MVLSAAEQIKEALASWGHRQGSTRPQIKAAIEHLYGVRVEKVSTQIRKGQTYRTRYGTTNSGDWKRATVQLHKDDRIELF